MKYDVLTKKLDGPIIIDIPKDYEFTDEDIEICKAFNHIKFNNDSVDTVWKGSLSWLPDNITHLELPNNYNEPLLKLPNNLKILKLGLRYNQNINLPEGLEQFICVYEHMDLWNQNIVYPKSLKKLILGNKFNQPLDNLPPNLETLMINSYIFNHPLDNLPYNLKHLIIISCSNFDKSLDNLPATLKSLVIIGKYDQPLDNLPIKLKTLIIHSEYSHSLNNLPLDLQYLSLVFYSFQYDYTFDNLPPNLEYIIIKLIASYENKNIIMKNTAHISKNKYSYPVTIYQSYEEMDIEFYDVDIEDIDPIYCDFVKKIIKN